MPGEQVFENDLPKRKVGVLTPLPVIDNGAYEFYRLVKDRIMLVMIPVGLSEFSGKDVERVFAPINSYLDKLMERRVDIVVQSGVPLPALIGVQAHDRLIAHMAQYTRRPATSSILGVVEAAKHLGIARLALANKWSDDMNRTLGEFFARQNIAVEGVASKVLAPSEFQKMSGDDNIQLAYELGRQALHRSASSRRTVYRRRRLAFAARRRGSRRGIRQAGDHQCRRDDPQRAHAP